MIVKKITLKNYGPHSNLAVDFKKTTVIYSSKPTGKTTLIDALQLGFSKTSIFPQPSTKMIFTEKNYGKIILDFDDNFGKKNQIKTIVYPEKTEIYWNEKQKTPDYFFNDFCLLSLNEQTINFWKVERWPIFHQAFLSLIPEYQKIIFDLDVAGKAWLNTLKTSESELDLATLSKLEEQIVQLLKRIYQSGRQEISDFNKLWTKTNKKYQFDLSVPTTTLNFKKNPKNLVAWLRSFRVQAKTWEKFQIKNFFEIKIVPNQNDVFSFNTTKQVFLTTMWLTTLTQLIAFKTKKTPCLILEILVPVIGKTAEKMTKLITDFNQCIIITITETAAALKSASLKAIQVLKLET